MACRFLYSRWDESFGGGTVTGTLTTGYTPAWLLDPSPLRPVRHASALSLTATAPAARTVGIIAALNGNLTGAVTAGAYTVPAATFGADGIPLNSYVLITPTSLSSLEVSASQSPAILGGLWAGQMRELQRQLAEEPELTYPPPAAWEGEASSLAPYDPGVTRRTLSGQVVVSDVGLAEIQAWHQSTRGGSRPTLIVPNDSVNDAWLVTFSYRHRTNWQSTTPGQSIHKVSFEFTEVPRVRW